MKKLKAISSHEFDWEQVVAALCERNGIKSGLWRLGVKVRFAAITGEWKDDGGSTKGFPTGLIGMEGVALFPADEPGVQVYDAAALSRSESLRSSKSTTKPPAKKN